MCSVGTLIRLYVLRIFFGNWVDNPCDVKRMIIDFFKYIFSASFINPIPFWFNPIGISIQQATFLDFIPSTEIKNALWNLKPYKAARPDGFKAGFFQINWNTVEYDVVNSIKKNVFVEECIPEGWNDTYICLIPKCPNPSEMKNFHPISLCSTMLKVVTKMLVLRLKPLIPSLVS